MKTHLFLALLAAALLPLHAATPPEKLLPAETLAFVTVPDMNKARAQWKNDPMAQLWGDPAMKPFADKFEAGFRANVLAAVEKELGTKIEEYTDLAQGQLTLALLSPAGVFDPHGALIVDTGDKAAALTKKLGEVKAKLIEQAKPHKIQTVGGAEFISLPQKGKGGKSSESFIGQSGSLLLIGDHLPTLEKIIARQSPNAPPGVAANLRFAARQDAQFRDALLYGWVDCEPMVKALMDMLGKNLPKPSPENPMAMQPALIAHALGLNGLKSMAFSMQTSPEGTLAEVYLDVPAAGRRGLFNLVATENADSTPPAFVGANVTSFGRWRQNLPRLWNNMIGMANEISPMAGAMVTFLEASIREKQPNFNLQAQLIANLGDDVLVVEQTPRGGKKIEDLLASNAIFLVGSAKPEVLSQAMRSVASISGQAPQTRDLDGRTIYSFGLGAAGNEDSGPKAMSGIHLAAAAGYVAIATDVASLEAYLRGPKENGKSLKDLPGLAAAAQKVGGMNTGFFGYENYRETMRGLWETMQKNPKMFTDFAPMSTMGISFPDWINLGAMPPFEKVEQYFHFWVYGMKTTPEGMQIRYFSPAPPALKK